MAQHLEWRLRFSNCSGLASPVELFLLVERQLHACNYYKFIDTERFSQKEYKSKSLFQTNISPSRLNIVSFIKQC